jgi:predicted nucleotidyltransferase
MVSEVEQRRPAVADLCRRYRVARLRLFGSAATGAFDAATSDLDFIAEFADRQAPDYADRYLDFAEALEHLFQRHVDVVTQRSVRNPLFRAEIERTARVVYEEHSTEAAA